MSTADPTTPPVDPAARVREALRNLRDSCTGQRIRESQYSLEVAVEALLAEHEQLIARMSVGRQASQPPLDSGALRLVRAHIDMALARSLSPTGGKGAEHHLRLALALFADFGVRHDVTATVQP